MKEINVHILSANPETVDGIKKVIAPPVVGLTSKPEEVITYSGYSQNFKSALKYLSENDGPKKHRNFKEGSRILFVEDISFDKIDTLNFLNILPKSFPIIKTIIYTDSIDYKYLNQIRLYNAGSILHRKETALSQVCGNFIETIKLVGDGKFVYDKLVADLLTKYSWAKGSIDRVSNHLSQKDHKRQNEKIERKIEIYLHNDDYKKLMQLKVIEKEILKLIADGLQNKEISVLIKYSVKTIEQYKNKLMHKLGFNCTTELYKFAILHRDEIKVF